MPTTNDRYYALLWLCLGSFTCFVTYQWLDRSVAFWVFEHHIKSVEWLKSLTVLPVIVVIITVCVYCGLLFSGFHAKISNKGKNSLLFVSTVALAYFFKSVLKEVFGRYGPMMLIHKGNYGFNWFHSGVTYGAFPSGHAAVMAAAMAALALTFPKWSGCFFLLWLLVAVGLVGMNYHFVSDVVGGGVLGIVLAYATHAMLFEKK